MAQSLEVESDATQSVTVVTTRREYGLYCWGLIVTLVLVAILIIVSVIVLLTSKNTVLILSILISIVLIIAIASFAFIEWQRREAIRNRDEGAREWIKRTLSQDKLPTPSAPPESAHTSWMFWRKNSTPNGGNSTGNQQQMPMPSAPPYSARSSWTISRKSYLPVYMAENRGR